LTGNDLKIKKCVKCEGVAKEVIYAQKKLRSGWYCETCNTFDKAIGRERQLLRHGS
jgi:hypothetical protein